MQWKWLNRIKPKLFVRYAKNPTTGGARPFLNPTRCLPSIYGHRHPIRTALVEAAEWPQSTAEGYGEQAGSSISTGSDALGGKCRQLPPWTLKIHEIYVHFIYFSLIFVILSNYSLWIPDFITYWVSSRWYACDLVSALLHRPLTGTTISGNIALSYLEKR